MIEANIDDMELFKVEAITSTMIHYIYKIQDKKGTILYIGLYSQVDTLHPGRKDIHMWQ